MYAHLTTGLALVSLAALTGLGTTAHAQGLNGQSVDVTHAYPTQTASVFDLGTQLVIPTGTMYSDGVTNVLVKPSQVVFTFASNNNFSPSAFNGFQIAETGASPVVITGVSLDPASNLPGFTASDISFDASDVFANFQGLNFVPGQGVTLDISSAPAAVPEASTFVSFAGGILAFFLLLRARRKSASTAL